MQFEQEESVRGVTDDVRIESYWKHFMMLKGPYARCFHGYQSLSLPVT